MIVLLTFSLQRYQNSMMRPSKQKVSCCQVESGRYELILQWSLSYLGLLMPNTWGRATFFRRIALIFGELLRTAQAAFGLRMSFFYLCW